MGWKKSLAVGLASVALLAGCGNSGSNNAKKDDGDAGGKPVLKVTADAQWHDFLKENKKDFEKANGCKVEMVDKDMFEALEALQLDGPAGTAPDVLIAPYDRIGILGRTGQLAEVKLNEEAKYDETDKKQVTADGKIYGAPAVIESLVMYYNKDLVEKAPTSFDELEALAKDSRFDFPDEKGKNTGFLAKWTDFYYAYGLLSGYGAHLFGESGTDTSKVGLNSPEAIQGIEYATGWFKNVWPKGMKDVKGAGDFVTQSFIKGKTAAVIAGPWDAKTFKEAGVKYGVAKIPTLKNGQPYKPFAGGKGFVLSNYSKQKELGQKFLDWLTSNDIQQKMYAKLNEVPANENVRASVDKNDELTQAVINTYKDAVPMPNIPEMNEVWAGAENLMFDAASGKQTAKEAANNSVKTIEQAIHEKY
ncbi:extracellular solute-binding protein [Atopobacter sp. AH10]|nr:extracellular solute-binding protein [Atopobacter sp. AH10]RLK64220.1 extracellular solute-binding protein [Atopobacter sp. AH10]